MKVGELIIFTRKIPILVHHRCKTMDAQTLVRTDQEPFRVFRPMLLCRLKHSFKSFFHEPHENIVSNGIESSLLHYSVNA